MTWFKRMPAPGVRSEAKASVPSGVWRLCDGCGTSSPAKEVAAALQTCPKCGHHYRVSARERLTQFLDATEIEEIGRALVAGDPLGFVDSRAYPDRITGAQDKVHERDAFVLAAGRLAGRPVLAGAFEFAFLGGSMGSVVGEKVTLAFEEGLARRAPVVLFSASGGARMQEGILSLMQMAKTSAAIARFRAARQPYISVLTDPTTGGVAASFAMLGDVIIAEPGALVGFAGPRVIEQTIRQKLPEGFQRSEFLLEHGVIDQIVPRGELRDRVARLCDLLVGAPA